MPNQDAVKAALLPICKAVAELDLTDPRQAESALARQFPDDVLAPIGAMLRAARDEGWLTPRRASAEVAFGRVTKALPETHGVSIDAVDMTGPGAEHVHPNGEVSLCVVDEGAPRFCGRPPGFVAMPPGSQHIPTVEGGRMVIVYFLPAGAIQFVGA